MLDFFDQTLDEKCCVYYNESNKFFEVKYEIRIRKTDC